jgi:hypothetical protein
LSRSRVPSARPRLSASAPTAVSSISVPTSDNVLVDAAGAYQLVRRVERPSLLPDRGTAAAAAPVSASFVRSSVRRRIAADCAIAGDGDLSRASPSTSSTSQRPRSLSLSALLRRNVEASAAPASVCSPGSACAATPSALPAGQMRMLAAAATTTTSVRNRSAESGATLFRDADATASSSGVDLFELGGPRFDANQVYSFGNIPPRILNFAPARSALRRHSADAAAATALMVVQSAPTTPRAESPPRANENSGSDTAADEAESAPVSSMHAQLRSAKSIFRVPTVITRRQAGPESESARPSARAINKVPFRVHDAPGVGSDFYLQLMAASDTRDQLAIVLSDVVYGMRWCDLGHTVLAAPRTGVGSVAFAQGNSRLLSVGTATGIQIYDAGLATAAPLIEYRSTISGVRRSHSSIAWRGENVFAVGQSDAAVTLWDVRIRSSQARTNSLNSHRGVVCGLAFGPDGRLASGGNDGLLNIWDLRRLDAPIASFDQHRAAAVKAIAWHPDVRNVLASGGGSADRYLRLWDVDARRCFNRRDSRSQITGLIWSTRHNELVSSHGYSEDAAVAVWSTPALQRVAQLHEINRRERALYMVGSHCGRFVAAADTMRTLSFYSLFVSSVEQGDDDENSDGNSTSAALTTTAASAAAATAAEPAERSSRKRSASSGASKRPRHYGFVIR